MKLPPQKVVLTVTHNKVQLIDFIVERLQDQTECFSNYQHKLVVTGCDPVPVQLHLGQKILRRDLANTEEEADVIIMHQFASTAEEGQDSSITVISDDTDVFVLLKFKHSTL